MRGGNQGLALGVGDGGDGPRHGTRGTLRLRVHTALYLVRLCILGGDACEIAVLMALGMPVMVP